MDKGAVRWKTIAIGVLLVLLAIFLVGVYMGGVVAPHIHESVSSLFGEKEYITTNMTLGKAFDYAFHEPLGFIFMVGTDLLLLPFVFLIWRNKTLFMGGKVDRDKKLKYSDKGTYGTAQWLTLNNAKKCFEIGKIEQVRNMIFGRIQEGDMPEWQQRLRMKPPLLCIPNTPYADNMNTLILGAAGSRKSRGLVMPGILQAAKRGESIVVTDPKGELYRDMSPFLKQQGYTVRVFDLFDKEHMNCSDSWNPFSLFIDEYGEIVTDKVRTYVKLFLASQQAAGGTTELYWREQAEQLFAAEVLRILEEIKLRKLQAAQPFTIEDISIGKIYKELIKEPPIELAKKYIRLSERSIAFDNAQGFASNASNDKLLANIYSGFVTKLQDFTDEELRNITTRPEIDLSLPAKEKCAYFIIIHPVNNTKQFLTATFFTYLFQLLMEAADNRDNNNNRCPVPVNVFMDEFANLGVIPDFDKVLSVTRGYDIRVSVVIQSISQLKAMYGGSDIWQTLVNNCKYIAILSAGNTKEQLEFISDLLGVATVKTETNRTAKHAMLPFELENGYMKSDGETRRLLMNPDEVRKLSEREMILVIQGYDPIKLDKFDISEYPGFEYFKKSHVKDHCPGWMLQYRIHKANQLLGNEKVDALNEKLRMADKLKELDKSKKSAFGRKDQKESEEQIETTENRIKEAEKIQIMNAPVLDTIKEIEAEMRSAKAELAKKQKAIKDNPNLTPEMIRSEQEQIEQAKQRAVFFTDLYEKMDARVHDLIETNMKNVITSYKDRVAFIETKKRELRESVRKNGPDNVKTKHIRQTIKREKAELDYEQKMYYKTYDLGVKQWGDKFKALVNSYIEAEERRRAAEHALAVITPQGNKNRSRASAKRRTGRRKPPAPQQQAPRTRQTKQAPTAPAQKQHSPEPKKPPTPPRPTVVKGEPVKAGSRKPKVITINPTEYTFIPNERSKK